MFASLQSGCYLTYLADKEDGYFAVAMQLEDYPPGSNPDEEQSPMSSIPLQFLVQVYESPGSPACASKPHFVAPTVGSGACVNLEVGEPYTTTIVARTKDSFTGSVSGHTALSVSTRTAESISTQTGRTVNTDILKYCYLGLLHLL